MKQKISYVHFFLYIFIFDQYCLRVYKVWSHRVDKEEQPAKMYFHHLLVVTTLTLISDTHGQIIKM